MNSPGYESRRKKLLRKLKDSAVDSLLITSVSSVRYLTGFTGDSSWLFLSPAVNVILSDTRYETQLAEECPGLDVEIRDAGSTISDLAGKVIHQTRSTRVGIEADYVTLSQHEDLREKATTASLVPTRGLVEQLREIKDKWELEQIRSAIRIAERGMAVVRSSLRPDQTETEIRCLLESAMRGFGASGPAFEPIVGVGPTAALPHAHAGDRKVSDSPIILIDWGAQTNTGYRSDLTRVFITGKPTRQMETVYRVVLEAQQAAIEAIKPGVRCADVDRIAREKIAAAGFGKHFGHGLGHGFGLDIHESLRISPLSHQILVPGMVLTVEPGVYLAGKFGVRIEDDVLVTERSCEVLTNVPREFEEAFVPLLA